MPESARTRARTGRLAAGVPRPLVALLVVVAVVGLCWAMIVPPWQSPDAFTHYAYTESLATRVALPGRSGHGEFSSNAQAADVAVGAHRIQWSSPEAKPSWNPAVARAYRAASAGLSRANGAGPTPSQANPPLYYALASIPYLATVGGNTLDRLNVIQLWGVLLLLATTTGGWLLAGEVFGRRRLLQLITAAVAGLEPMETFISTSVNPDALLVALWTFALWLGARVISRAAPRRDVIALCGVTAAAIVTKETSYALLPAVALALVVGWRRRPVADRVRASETYGPALLALGVPVLAWLVAVRAAARPALTIGPPSVSTSHGLSYIVRFFDYLWQFYLPRLPGQSPFHLPTLSSLPWPRVPPGLPVWNIWIRGGWGLFGWLNVYLPGWVYGVLAVVTAVVAVVGLSIVARFRDRLRLSLLGYFALALGALLAIVHVIEYETLTSGQGPFDQGRYVLPVVSLFGLATALVVGRAPARYRGPLAAVVVVGLLALQVLALATVARTYYT